MEKKSSGIGKLNLLASAVAFLFAVYILIVYIALMTGNKPNTIGYEIMSDYAHNWIYRFVLVLVMYFCILVNFVSIPSYLFLKGRKSGSPAKKYFAAAQLAATGVMLLAAILFWASFGPLFSGDMASPFATQYRILEVIFIPVMAGVQIFNIAYAPSDDMMKQLKKQHNRI